MIIYPKRWLVDYSLFYNSKPKQINIDIIIESIINSLTITIKELNISHLLYSGGIDSTILLAIMKKETNVKISTYTITSNKQHPDCIFSKLGSDVYKTNHHQFFTSRKYVGIKELFNQLPNYTNNIICGDGIDEFGAGYYKHQDCSEKTYIKYLKDLTPNHLIPLNKISKSTKVHLPYLNPTIINLLSNTPLIQKVNRKTRKKITVEIAKILDIPEEIIHRRKYGFCDANL